MFAIRQTPTSISYKIHVSMPVKVKIMIKNNGIRRTKLGTYGRGPLLPHIEVFLGEIADVSINVG
jgi:hypothetical protein